MVKGFNSKAQICCSVWCVVALIFAIAGTITAHVGFNMLIDPLIALPKNLEKGINEVLHFATLPADAQKVINLAESALTKCSYQVSQCPTPPSAGTKATLTEIASIQATFASSLSKVEKVANDKYLGIGEFAKTATDLKKMHQELDKVKAMPQPLDCDVVGRPLCSIHKAGTDIKAGYATVKKGVDKITKGQAVKDYEKVTKDVKKGVHALPYIFWLSLPFYLCFLCSKRPSCKGGMMPCCACTWHTIVFVDAFIIALVVVSIGIAVIVVSKDVKLTAPFKGSPTVDQIVTHIETNFPAFYDLVLKNLIAGMRKTLDAWIVFLVAHIMMMFHGCSCCCGLYIDAPKASE